MRRPTASCGSGTEGADPTSTWHCPARRGHRVEVLDQEIQLDLIEGFASWPRDAATGRVYSESSQSEPGRDRVPRLNETVWGLAR